jgi:hypothetical protein
MRLLRVIKSDKAVEYAVKHIYGIPHFNRSNLMQIPSVDKIKIIGVRPRVFFSIVGIVVSVLNYGQNDVTLSAVAIFDDRGIMIDSIPLSEKIKAGETKNIPISIELSSNRRYEVKVITARGAEAAYSFIAKA